MSAFQKMHYVAVQSALDGVMALQYSKHCFSENQYFSPCPTLHGICLTLSVVQPSQLLILTTIHHARSTHWEDKGGGYKFNRFQFGNAAICWAFPQIRVSRCPGNGNINIEVRWGLKGACSDMKVFKRNMFSSKFDPVSWVFVKLHSLCSLYAPSKSAIPCLMGSQYISSNNSPDTCTGTLELTRETSRCNNNSGVNYRYQWQTPEYSLLSIPVQ